MTWDRGPVKDTYCKVCQFRISEGVYAYMAGRDVFCQRCVRGPHPYGREPVYEELLPTQRPALESDSKVSSPL
jgi:hypothetical protein